MVPTETMDATGARLVRADGTPMTVLYVVTEDWYFCSHRLPIARTRVDRHAGVIAAEGFGVVALPWRRRIRNPLSELYSIVKLARLYRRERPDVIHHVAVKPTVYGGVAAVIAGARPVVNAIAGLGYVSVSQQRRARFVRTAIRWLFRRLLGREGAHVIVQNPDDAAALTGRGLADIARTHIIRGSGVDTERFRPAPPPGGAVTCTMVARMVRPKGVEVMVDAARRLAARGCRVRVRLVGDPDGENPESIPRRTLEAWAREGVVEWTAQVDDILPVWHDTHIAALPTYREGLPKTLLEAGACGLPIVATDVPGCREVVRHGENGLLVPARDATALADAVETLASDPDARRRMGARGREIVAAEFSDAIVARETIALYRLVAAEAGGAR
jgi:glycosyltransferase involved in cell wall biosynthesis